MSSRILTRRAFVRTAAGLVLLPRFRRHPSHDARPLVMGMIADLHFGLEPTAHERLEAFMEAMAARRPDSLLQLGDFNFATPESRICTELWNTFDGPRYHVLGNHDMDFVTKEAVVEAWEMPGRYYSFDLGGIHFVVLDRNNLKTDEGYVPYGRANFYVDAALRAHADPEQLEWLRADLRDTEFPVVVFVHQGLGVPEEAAGDPARVAIERILAERNRDAEGPGVVACFCGHHHLDRYAYKDEIHYVWVNSASYYWVGDAYGRMAPYRDALFATVSFFPDGQIEIEGRRSDWVSPSPDERGFPDAAGLTPYISDRRLSARSASEG